MKRQALGRGLNSLIPMDDVPATGSSAINDIPLDSIVANPDQPRTTFNEEAIEELAASIRELGIIQPLSLRKTGDNTYQIIAGERRFRAARLAGLESVPAYIRTADDLAMTEMALIENIQREDLNAIEISLAFKKLIEQYQLTQERLSERIGKKRATIANYLRLLQLPAEIQLGLRDGLIGLGHAKAICSIDDPTLQLKVYKEIVKNGVSVRKLEEIIRKLTGKAEAEKTQKKDSAESKFSQNDFNLLKKHLSATFRTPVHFSMDRSGKGKISFPFQNDDELAKLITIFDSLNRKEPRD